MNQQMMTIVAPLDPRHLERAETLIDVLETAVHADPPATPLSSLDDAGGSGTHFASLHAIASRSSDKSYLLMEFSADGDQRSALDRLCQGFGEPLLAVFALASDWKDGGGLAEYMSRHLVRTGPRWSDQPGLPFCGSPGMSVGQIRLEAKLAEAVADLLQTPGIADADGALAKLEAVRSRLEKTNRWQFLPSDADQPWEPTSLIELGFRSVGSLLTTFFWPLLLIGALAALALIGIAAHHAWLPRYAPPDPAHAMTLWCAIWIAGKWLLKKLLELGLVLLVLLLAVAGITYGSLRAAEASDAVDDRAPDPLVNAEIFRRENRCRQNHMISVTVRKPGLLRAFTARLVFWLLGRAVGVLSPPGFLGTIGTIHFARWVTPPGTRDLVFLSNYDGSWESYLEDFITRAHEGLTGVWSNCVGFPRTSNLIQDGATDSERFKRFARASMIPTRFWYSAYPQLTMASIRTNREVRRGLTGAMTEDEAAKWLSLFGSAARPDSKLVSSGIQSILFGGLKFMNFSRALVIEHLPDRKEDAKLWLEAIQPHIAYNDGRRLRRSSVVILGLGPRGLARLGLPEESVATFPFAFVEGMTGPGRQQILGDNPREWSWGRNGADAVLIVYGDSARAVTQLCNLLTAATARQGASAPHVIPLETFREDKTEPFGFVDGISQPIIRGTYKALRSADPIHLVEPGEFILGYPDGRRNMPPGPVLDALHDPENLLPLADPSSGFDRTQVENPRDVGFNGSFLVIREFEQDVKGFRQYCKQESDRLSDDPRLPQPYVVTPEFIGAKLVGRWPDGSSLARFPYTPRSADAERSANPTVRPATQPGEDHEPIDRAPHSDKAHGGDNDFLFGAEDPEALRCPFGAHIRRSNPRDSLAPGAADEIDITNRHRIIRVGRPLAARKANARPGILFMCLNGDIERQFEFVQQTWVRNPAFHGLTCEKDPLLGDGEVGACSFTIATRDGPIRLSPMAKPFVKLCGGGYFFLPGKRLVDYLAATQ